MPAVLYDGYAFTYGGKLYVDEACPPCCFPCCPTGEQLRYIQSQASLSGLPALYTEYTLHENEDFDQNNDGLCVYSKERREKTIEVTGLDALNGTYADSPTSECGDPIPEALCESEPLPDGCRRWVIVPAVDISVRVHGSTYRESPAGNVTTDSTFDDTWAGKAWIEPVRIDDGFGGVIVKTEPWRLGFSWSNSSTNDPIRWFEGTTRDAGLIFKDSNTPVTASNYRASDTPLFVCEGEWTPNPKIYNDQVVDYPGYHSDVSDSFSNSCGGETVRDVTTYSALAMHFSRTQELA